MSSSRRSTTPVPIAPIAPPLLTPLINPQYVPLFSPYAGMVTPVPFSGLSGINLVAAAAESLAPATDTLPATTLDKTIRVTVAAPTIQPDDSLAEAPAPAVDDFPAKVIARPLRGRSSKPPLRPKKGSSRVKPKKKLSRSNRAKAREAKMVAVEPDSLKINVFCSIVPTGLIRESHMKYPSFIRTSELGFDSGSNFTRQILPLMQRFVSKISHDSDFEPYEILEMNGATASIYVSSSAKPKKTNAVPIQKEKD